MADMLRKIQSAGLVLAIRKLTRSLSEGACITSHTVDDVNRSSSFLSKLVQNLRELGLRWGLISSPPRVNA
jgi:hypothetical protein